jgi:hypothetical protein
MSDDKRRAAASTHAEIGAHLEQLAARKRRTLARIKAGCAETRRRARERAAAWAAAERARIRQEAAAIRRAAGVACKARTAKARAVAKTRAEQLRAERRAAEALRREVARADALIARRKRQSERHTRERRAESDDAVRAELVHEPHLIPVWEKVKRGIRGNAKMSRAEAFAHWAHDNPGEVWAIVGREAEKQVRKLEREQRAMARAAQQKRPSGKRIEAARRELKQHQAWLELPAAPF